jgi:hypothetical protein
LRSATRRQRWIGAIDQCAVEVLKSIIGTHTPRRKLNATI